MSIDLKNILKRNRIDIETFFLKNQIENYEQLCEHCKNVDIIPISKDEYTLLAKKEEAATPKIPKEKKIKEAKIEKPKQRKRTTRAPGKTQTRQKRRTSTKKVNNT